MGRERISRLFATLNGVIPVVLLHGISGAAGFWDEVITLGLIAAIVAVLGALAYFGGKKRKRRSQ
jgi:hypothetical protein